MPKQTQQISARAVARNKRLQKAALKKARRADKDRKPPVCNFICFVMYYAFFLFLVFIDTMFNCLGRYQMTTKCVLSELYVNPVVCAFFGNVQGSATICFNSRPIRFCFRRDCLFLPHFVTKCALFWFGK